MREKHLTEAIRCSLENFGSFSHTDKEDGDTARNVSVIPLYAVSQIIKITTSDRVQTTPMDFMLYNYPSA